jgi:hypothetical protein
MTDYARGGLIEGPPDPEFEKRIKATLTGCPMITAEQVRRFGGPFAEGLLKQLNEATLTPPAAEKTPE